MSGKLRTFDVSLQPVAAIQNSVQPKQSEIIDNILFRCLEELRKEPILEPYLDPEYIYDAVGILQYETIQAILDVMYPKYEFSGVSETPTTIPQESINKLKVRGEIETKYLNDGYLSTMESVGQDPTTSLRLGLTKVVKLAETVQTLPDGFNPGALIKHHNTQEAHRAAYLVEKELIMHEPDVVERDDMQCSKCSSRRIIAIQKQDRSGDEAGTVHAQCVDCKSRWKFSAA